MSRRSTHSLVQADYDVIFLSRTGSLLPFLSECQEEMADAFHLSGGESLEVAKIETAMAIFQKYSSSGAFLHVPFTTVFEYLQAC